MSGFVAYWANKGQRSAPGLNGSVAIDPTATLAVRVGPISTHRMGPRIVRASMLLFPGQFGRKPHVT